MWTCTNFGFFSATQRTDKKPAELIKAGDNRTLQIRARELSHLEALRVFMGDALGPTIEIPNRDYQARAYCTPEAWGRALYEMSMDIDYGNFKNSVKDHTLHDAYMKVWSAMAAAYGTGYSTYAGGAGWTDYATSGTSKYASMVPGYTSSSKVTTSHAYVPSKSPDDGWCGIMISGKPCDFMKHEHQPKDVKAAADTKAETPGKRGSRRGKAAAIMSHVVESVQLPLDDVIEDDVAGAMARIADGLDALGYTDSDIQAMTDAEVEELLLNAADAEDLLLDDATGVLSLNKAAKKVGSTTKELREFMKDKPEWNRFRDENGHSWLIPEDEIDELEFKFWAEVGGKVG